MPRAKLPFSADPATSQAGTTAEGLPLQARLRLEHAGQWVAWTEDGGRIVAAADEYETVRTAARQAGVERHICEWLPPMDQEREANSNRQTRGCNR